MAQSLFNAARKIASDATFDLKTVSGLSRSDMWTISFSGVTGFTVFANLLTSVADKLQLNGLFERTIFLWNAAQDLAWSYVSPLFSELLGITPPEAIRPALTLALLVFFVAGTSRILKRGESYREFVRRGIQNANEQKLEGFSPHFWLVSIPLIVLFAGFFLEYAFTWGDWFGAGLIGATYLVFIFPIALESQIKSYYTVRLAGSDDQRYVHTTETRKPNPDTFIVIISMVTAPILFGVLLQLISYLPWTDDPIRDLHIGWVLGSLSLVTGAVVYSLCVNWRDLLFVFLWVAFFLLTEFFYMLLDPVATHLANRLA